MMKTLVPAVTVALSLVCSGCLSSASSFVTSSAPLDQGGYTEVATEVSGTCTQVQWLFFTFGKAGSPQRHALVNALEQCPGSNALTAMAVDVEQFSFFSTSIMSSAVLPVVSRTRVTGTPVKLNAQ